MSGKPCARCKKRSTCFGFCHAFEVYLTMRNTRLIRISCSKEHCTNKKFELPCLFYNDGTCMVYRYAEWRWVE
jgi:hypothetical protein